MEIEIGRAKRGRRAYSFDDIAIVPARRTRDPEEVSVAWQIDAYRFEIPVLAAPMDSVMSPRTAIDFGKHGGLGVRETGGLGRESVAAAEDRWIVRGARGDRSEDVRLNGLPRARRRAGPPGWTPPRRSGRPDPLLPDFTRLSSSDAPGLHPDRGREIIASFGGLI